MIEAIAAAIFGLFLGRFLNLTMDRLPPQHAKTPLNLMRQRGQLSLSLLPLVGHFGLLEQEQGGVRRFARSLAVETITASLCGIIAYQHGLTVAAAVLIFYCALFIHFTFVDLEHSLILNKVVLPALPVALLLFPFSPLGQSWDIPEAFLRSLVGAGIGFTVMLVVYIASRGGTGAGDVKLAALLGAILGFPQIIAGLPVGFFLGGVVGIALLLLRIKGRKDAMPFGPALVIGSALVLLLGSGVYDWYLGLFR